MKWSLKPSKFDLIVGSIILLVLLGLLVLYGPGYRIDYYSCHKCRNTKKAHARTFLFWRWPKGEEISTEHPVKQGHTHEWWRYATSTWGLTPLAGGSARSRNHMYKDGWEPPSRAEEAAPSTSTAPASAGGPSR